MVMDVTPTPQCVGREFVRQYYTLLNKAPTHVHRFYNNNSSFVHGGLEAFNREGKPAVGQKQIHQCIQQLNFRDCHAKITQVDSQATLGNGVVVQVTGELSNGGQPMRRFTQTFVLGAQSPKQYYVHNDIFRYQDLVFGDEEADAESHHYEADDEESEHPPQPEILQVQAVEQQAQFYVSAPQIPAVNGTPHVEEPQVPAQPLPQAPPPPAPTTPTFDIISQPHVACGYQSEECEPEPEEEFVSEEVPEDKPVDDYNTVTEQDQPATDNILSNEPKTYASTLVKSTGGGSSNFNTSPNAPSKSPPSPPPSMTRLENRNNEINTTGGRGGIRSQRGIPNMRGMGRGGDMNRPPMSRPPVEDNRDYGYRDDQGLDGERRRPINTQAQYPDDHQLFLGNLPLNASENDLREVFKEFGNIVDLRIMSKSNVKGQNGNKVPNYGFIIFDSVQTVQHVLNSRPIFFPGDMAVKLNVEEKKTKPRTDSGGRGGARSAPMGMRGSLSRGGQRGGFARGGGGLRPGAGFSQRGAPR
ncbi:ras GTPase-activating protein-binding protein 1 isoform X1 [Homalodisca vitripennis]|uniref:ras GTPase-activating protein-binding protein 1 isoform X1 n=1 Tax=Homalodisca vitripennis TaxID=197043 RepID=UPI001EECB75B|nr:ras GTPase-activating protein-binding protein 1 isoform X1 [Homalodisca vitripennis]